MLSPTLLELPDLPIEEQDAFDDPQHIFLQMMDRLEHKAENRVFCVYRGFVNDAVNESRDAFV
jgi:hypothetical protein